MDNLKKNFKRLEEEGKYTVVVLDACRYDVFRMLINDFFGGHLFKARTPGTDTFTTVQRVFTERRENLKVFTAHPAINKADMVTNGLKPSDHFCLDNITELFNAQTRGEKFVDPFTMLDQISRSDLGDKNLIWLTQPHAPYARMSDEECDKWKGTPFEYYNKHIDDPKVLQAMYVENLAYALSAVHHWYMATGLGDRDFNFIITSDHGEMLGEHGFVLHRGGLDHPKIREVPWLNVSQPKSNVNVKSFVNIRKEGDNETDEDPRVLLGNYSKRFKFRWNRWRSDM